MNEVLGKVQTGLWTPDKKITVKELLTEWLAAKKSQGLRASTLAQYRNVVDSWLVPNVGGIQLPKMSPSQAQQLAEQLRARGGRHESELSARSVQLSITVLKAATAWAFETGLVGRVLWLVTGDLGRRQRLGLGHRGLLTRREHSSWLCPTIGWWPRGRYF